MVSILFIFMMSAASSRAFQPKNRFSKKDDDLLRNLVKEFGPKNWKRVAELMPGRNPRQCRERWINYVNPTIRKKPWTPEEDELLREKFQEMGPKWRLIVKHFPHRSTNQIKNRFFTIQKYMAKVNEYPESETTESDSVETTEEFDDVQERRKVALLPEVQEKATGLSDAILNLDQFQWFNDDSAFIQNYEFFSNNFTF